MTVHPYNRKLDRLLDRMGWLLYHSGYFSGDRGRTDASPLLRAIPRAVTQIAKFPRGRLLEILVVIGSLGDCQKLSSTRRFSSSPTIMTSVWCRLMVAVAGSITP